MDSLAPLASTQGWESPPLPAFPWFGSVLAVILLVASTAALSGNSRVPGAAPPRTTPDGTAERWDGETVTVVIDDSVESIDSDAREALENSFGTWLGSGADLPNLVFDSSDAETWPAQDGVSTVSFRPIKLKGHKKDLALTICYVDKNSGRIREADMVFNTRYDFRTDHEWDHCGQEYDLQSVATHEAGHFFGLGEDTEDVSTTMYFKTPPCDTKKRDLAPPDRESITMLYSTSFDLGSEDEPSVGCSLGRAPVDRSPALGWAALILAVAVRRSRHRRLSDTSPRA